MEVYIGSLYVWCMEATICLKMGMDPSQCPSPKIRGECEAGGYFDVSCTCD